MRVNLSSKKTGLPLRQAKIGERQRDLGAKCFVGDLRGLDDCAIEIDLGHVAKSAFGIGPWHPVSAVRPEVLTFDATEKQLLTKISVFELINNLYSLREDGDGAIGVEPKIETGRSEKSPRGHDRVRRFLRGADDLFEQIACCVLTVGLRRVCLRDFRVEIRSLIQLLYVRGEFGCLGEILFGQGAFRAIEVQPVEKLRANL